MYGKVTEVNHVSLFHQLFLVILQVTYTMVQYDATKILQRPSFRRMIGKKHKTLNP